MSTFKKMLALALALAMVLSFSAFAADYKADTYKDAANIDKNCADAIELMYALDIMKGDTQGNFNPTGTITRAEIAKMIYVVLNKGNDDQAVNFKYNQMFSDVTGDAWYAGYVNYCAATKLIDGYNGKFNPNSPVTTAQAAKMLLTAIGYSSEERSYTGANWEKNVLSDAAIVGLLDDYNWPTNQNAPRQWVAVMFENMLLKAYTYHSVRPGSANGLMTGSMGEFNYDQQLTMGEKYYDLADKTGYLFATDCAYIDVVTENGKNAKKTDLVGTGNVLADGDDGYDAVFATSSGEKNWIHVKGAGLGYMDLGQQYRVIWNTYNDRVYSVRNTGKSAVGEARLEDITVVNSQSTSKNDALNRYVFTIGNLEGRLQGSNASAQIKALRVNTREDAWDAYENNYTATVLRNEMNKSGTNSANLYHAVDKDGNGTIDYMIILEYQYGQVNNVRNHKYYGDYFTAVYEDAALKPTGFKNPETEKGDTTNWYLSDVVNCDTDIEKGNAIKVVYNFDKDKYDVEVLPVATGTFEKMTTKKVYTIDGEDYKVAKALSKAVDQGKDFYDTTEAMMVRGNLKTEITIAYDGDLIVLAGKVKGGYTDIDEVNAQLVLVTDAYLDIRSNNKNQLYIDYLTIDGATHEEVRYTQDLDEGYQDFYDLLNNKTRVANNDNGDIAHGAISVDSNGNLQGSREMLREHQRLFKLVEHDDGTVSLIKLTPDDVETVEDNSQDELDYADSLLDGYRECGHDLTEVNLDTAKNKIDGDFIAGENKFFFSYEDSKSRVRFAVGTLDELADGSTYAKVDGVESWKHACIQGLYQTKRGTDTYLAGHIFYEGLNLGTENGYLYTGLDYAYDIKDDYWYLEEAVFSGSNPDRGTIQIDEIDNGSGSAKVSKTNNIRPLSLYSYTCEKVKGDYVYNLTLIDERDMEQAVTKGNENFHFDFQYGYDAVADEIVADELTIVGVNELTNSYTVSGDHYVIIGGEEIKVTSSAVIALKQVELAREHTLVRGKDGVYFDEEADINFITWDELVEEEDGVSVNRIYNGTNVGSEYDDDVTFDYFSDIYYKTNSDGNITALYVIVYAREIEAND